MARFHRLLKEDQRKEEDASTNALVAPSTMISFVLSLPSFPPKCAQHYMEGVVREALRGLESFPMQISTLLYLAQLKPLHDPGLPLSQCQEMALGPPSRADGLFFSEERCTW